MAHSREPQNEARSAIAAAGAALFVSLCGLSVLIVTISSSAAAAPSQAQTILQKSFNPTLSSIPVSGTLEFPGEGTAKAGSFVVSDDDGTIPISADGNQIGRARIRSTQAAAPAPPTIVRFGDVGVQPAGCPSCPVVDTQAVELQKEQMADNEKRIERLETVIDANRQKLVRSVDDMRVLKSVMSNAVFDMKEDLRKEETDIANKMILARDHVGPQGARGPPGVDGANGVSGIDGPQGIAGQPGPQGTPGLPGPPGPPGRQGTQGGPGGEGVQGDMGLLGPAGPAGLTGPMGPDQADLKCSRIGGQIYKGICFKSSELENNADLAPSGCKTWRPQEKWDEWDWWNLAQMFEGKCGSLVYKPCQLSSAIDRGSRGGLCNNFRAVMSFTQGGEFTQVWVNSETFGFVPTRGGATCTLYNGDPTLAVYACAV